MNKLITALLVMLLLGSLTACQNHRTVPPGAAMAQHYQGVIPCADCEGIQVSLVLQDGGTYQLNERYLGTTYKGDEQRGTWTRTAEKLVLVSGQGEKRYFRPIANGLEMLDTEGNPAQSINSYRLSAVKTGN